MQSKCPIYCAQFFTGPVLHPFLSNFWALIREAWFFCNHPTEFYSKKHPLSFLECQRAWGDINPRLADLAHTSLFRDTVTKKQLVFWWSWDLVLKQSQTWALKATRFTTREFMKVERCIWVASAWEESHHCEEVWMSPGRAELRWAVPHEQCGLHKLAASPCTAEMLLLGLRTAGLQITPTGCPDFKILRL